MNFLDHFGMKWGVRLYQNKDGSLTAAGRKRYAKKNYNTEFAPKAAEFGYEYNKSNAGSNKLKSYRSSWSKLIDYDGDSDEEEQRLSDDFLTKQEDYLKSQQTYVANKLRNYFGDQKFTDFVRYCGRIRYNVKDVDSAVNAFIDEWKVRRRARYYESL